MDTIDEIEAQLRNLPEGVDPIKAAASEIHRERQRYEDEVKKTGQFTEMISELQAELAELRAKNPA
jgi:uncharacterized protein (DUF3084 family)